MTAHDKINCLLISGIFPPDIGGPARFIPRLASELISKNIKCSIVTLSDNGLLTDSYPFRVHCIRRRQNYGLRLVSTILKIYQQRQSNDVFFANGLYFETAVAASLARKPLIIKIVGDEIWERVNLSGRYQKDVMSYQSHREWKSELFRMMRRYALCVSKRIVVPSKFTAELVAKWVKHARPIEIVPNAVEVLPDVPSLNIPFQQNTLRIITASRFIPLKRIDGLIRAVAHIPKTSLVVVGDGPEGHRLKRLSADLGISDRILFMGPMSHRDTLAAIKDSKIFVLNSTVENFPHVILEAMMMGCPVIATRVGGIPEIIAHEINGLLIEPTNEKSLVESINRLMHDGKLRDRIIMNGRETVKRFSWDRIGDRIIEILKDAIKSSQ